MSAGPCLCTVWRKFERTRTIPDDLAGLTDGYALARLYELFLDHKKHWPTAKIPMPIECTMYDLCDLLHLEEEELQTTFDIVFNETAPELAEQIDTGLSDEDDEDEDNSTGSSNEVEDNSHRRITRAGFEMLVISMQDAHPVMEHCKDGWGAREYVKWKLAEMDVTVA